MNFSIFMYKNWQIHYFQTFIKFQQSLVTWILELHMGLWYEKASILSSEFIFDHLMTWRAPKGDKWNVIFLLLFVVIYYKHARRASEMSAGAEISVKMNSLIKFDTFSHLKLLKSIETRWDQAVSIWAFTFSFCRKKTDHGNYQLHPTKIKINF